jgi:hypothetical protein
MGWGVAESSVGLIGVQDPEADRLPDFFLERGFGVRRWPTLMEASRLSGVKHAIIVFADAFAAELVVPWVQQVRKADAKRLVIILTAAAANFAGSTALRGKNVLLLVRPVLAWQLVDLIRHHVQEHRGGIV